MQNQLEEFWDSYCLFDGSYQGHATEEQFQGGLALLGFMDQEVCVFVLGRRYVWVFMCWVGRMRECVCVATSVVGRLHVLKGCSLIDLMLWLVASRLFRCSA